MKALPTLLFLQDLGLDDRDLKCVIAIKKSNVTLQIDRYTYAPPCFLSNRPAVPSRTQREAGGRASGVRQDGPRGTTLRCAEGPHYGPYGPRNDDYRLILQPGDPGCLSFTGF